MLAKIRAMMRDQAGATAVEYGLIVAIIVIGLLLALIALADLNARIWGTVAANVSEASRN